MNQVNRNLVFDIGLNNGDDSAYYLSLGHDVVGLDANPSLVAQCSRRFESEIRKGRAKIVNAGVLKEPVEFTFYSNLRRRLVLLRAGRREDRGGVGRDKNPLRHDPAVD
jgi:hypothetical protein